MSADQTPRQNRIEKVARYLWDEARREFATGGSMPPSLNYADGQQEPMPWKHQDAKLHAYFLRRARRLIRVVRGGSSGEGRAPEPFDFHGTLKAMVAPQNAFVDAYEAISDVPLNLRALVAT